MTIEERFEKIEKKNEKLENEVRTLSEQKGRLRRLSLASIALALAALIGGTALSVRAYTMGIEPSFVTTHQLILKDSANIMRALINGFSGAFTLNGANGKQRVGMSADDGFSMHDANGKIRVKLGMDGSIMALDSNSMPRVILNASDNKIYFRNASGAIVAAYPQ